MLRKLSNITNDKLLVLFDGEIDMALKRRAIKVIQVLNIKKGDRVLEAGCGHGYYLSILKSMSYKIDLYGIDLDDSSFPQIKKELKIKHLFKADLTNKLPFKSGFFDKIILSEVLEHVSDETLVLKQLYRVLKPGGSFVLTVPNKNYPFLWDPVNWLFTRLFNKHITKGLWGGIWTNHRKLYSFSDLSRILNKAHYSILDWDILTFWCLPFNHNLLYGGKLSKLPKSVSKNILKEMSNKGVIWNLILKMVNFNDRLNDYLRIGNIGVGIIVNATKK